MARFLGLRGARLTSAISAICGLCFLCYGYAQGVMGGLLTVPAFLERFPQVDIVSSSSFHSAWVTGLAIGSWNLGCVVSAILAVFISDSLGRRRTLLLGITLWTIGEIIQTSSYSFVQFIIGRAVAGFGNGFTTSTAPAYQAECVKSHRKGTVLMITAGAFVSLGYALSYWSVFGFAYINNADAAWRVPIALQITFAIPAISMLFFLPDSPRWLILTGREQEALTVIAALNDDSPDGDEVRDEFLQIKDAILVMAQGSTAKLFSNKDRRGFHRVTLAFLVQILQQGTGINLVLQYLSWILLTRMGYSEWLSRLLASCSATSYFFASLITVVGIDRFWGRRSLMMFGAAGMSGCMILLTTTQYLWTIQDYNAARIASTVFLFMFLMFFAIGWQGMAWLYQVEIVPLRIRGPANALSTLGNWLINFIIVFITPIAFANIGYRTWIIFAVTNFAIVPIIYFLYPETAFRSLEEVDVIFFLADEEPGNPWLNAVRISLTEPLWYGKNDEGRIGFDYANSSWHRKLADTSSGSSNEKPDRRDSPINNDSNVERSFGFSDSRTMAPQPLFAKRHDQESPIDPMMYYQRTNMAQQDPIPPHTFKTTIVTQHNGNPTRSNRHELARSSSSEQHFEQERLAEQKEYQLQQRILALNALHLSSSPSPEVDSFDDDDDPILAPAPLRISRPSSGEQGPLTPDSITLRPYTSESTRHLRNISESTGHRPYTSDSTSVRPYTSDSTRHLRNASESTVHHPYISDSIRLRPYTSDSTMHRQYTSESNRQRPYTSDSTRKRPRTSDSTRHRPHTSDSTRHRPHTSDSSHRAFHHPSYVAHATEVDATEHDASEFDDHERPSISSSDGGEIIMSFSYPGRLRSLDLRRTPSGRGIDDGDVVDDERRESVVSGRARARGAGRAY